ncbi:CRTAC1 family protein [Hydrogenophaga crassostreae]|uniref:CRTAC1 family protein n=1 Tax=Hydrogenophaga crassostreae TaxID=1763535 RepID=UPI000AE24CFB|nr:CRTAC1 family protein [Hydrogenophaga crassostreae]
MSVSIGKLAFPCRPLFVLSALLASAPAWAEAPALPTFVEETDTAGLQSRFEGEGEYMVGGGVATFDCDGDGLPEAYVTAGVNKAKLYRNQSPVGGALKLHEERSGLELTNAIGAYPLDIDGDGATDLVVLRVGEVQVFRGLGQCQFQRANDAWQLHTGNGWHTAFSATWEKGQSWPTLAFGTYVDRSKPDFPWGSCTPGMVFRPRPEGGGYLPATPLLPGHCALSMLFSDWNRSGTASLRVSNDREYFKGGGEQLWQLTPGNAPALYTEKEGWKPLQIWGMGIASQDITGDGFPELFLTSMSDNKLQALEDGHGQPRYTDTAYKRGATAHRPYVGGDVHPSTAWHAQFADLNNDGRADLFIAKGNVSTMPDFATLDPNDLLLQSAEGHFIQAGSEAGLASFKRGRGAMVVDFNADGLLDIIVVNRWDGAQLWRQLPAKSAAAPSGHWLHLRLQQPAGNRDAIGSWVEVRLGTEAGAAVARQELTVGGGHASGHLGWMHFGLGDAQKVQVRVQWPHGDWSEWFTADANRFYQLGAQGLSASKVP